MTSFNITKSLPTTEQLSSFKDKLEQVKAAGYLLTKQPDLVNKFNAAEQEALENWAEMYGANNPTADDLIQIINAVQTINITVAVRLPNSSLETISMFLSNSTNQPTAVTQILDPSILGGAVIGYKGRVFTHTLLQKLTTKNDT